MALTLALAVVITNAQVLTMSPAQPRAGALAVVDGKIAYVGDDVAAARRAGGPAAEWIDAGGRTVMPGFNDAHVHFGLTLTLGSDHGVDLPESSRAAFIAAVKRASSARRDDDWLFVKIRALPDGIKRARDLDFEKRPLFVVSAHGGIFNTAGLRRGGFRPDEAPSGFVRGRALAAALDRVVKGLPFKKLRAGARAFLAELARNGITSVQLIDEMPELFEGLRAAGELTARVRMIPLGFRLETRLYEPSATPPAPEWVRVDGVKFFHDDGARIPRWELAEIFERSLAAQRRVVVHVLSRRALDTLLDAVEHLAKQAGKPEATRLWRVEHADEVTPEQARRLARLGIAVCSNPSMLPEWRRDGAFPLRTLKAAGVRTCIGTDYVGRHLPERPLSPWSSVALAVTHGGYGYKERLSVEEALEAYTVGSAAAEGLASVKGSLEPGRFADLIVVSRNPLEAPPETLAELEVLLTMVGGRIVHRAGPFAPRVPPPPSIGPPRPPTIGPPRPKAPPPSPKRK